MSIGRRGQMEIREEKLDLVVSPRIDGSCRDVDRQISTSEVFRRSVDDVNPFAPRHKPFRRSHHIACSFRADLRQYVRLKIDHRQAVDLSNVVAVEKVSKMSQMIRQRVNPSGSSVAFPSVPIMGETVPLYLLV